MGGQASWWAPHLPSVTAVTKEQAVLPVTAATHLAEGGVFLLLLSGSGILHRNLEADKHCYSRMWQVDPHQVQTHVGLQSAQSRRVGFCRLIHAQWTQGSELTSIQRLDVS